MLLEDLAVRTRLRRWLLSRMRRYLDGEGVKLHRTKAGISATIRYDLLKRIHDQSKRHGAPSLSSAIETALQLGVDVMEQLPPRPPGDDDSR